MSLGRKEEVWQGDDQILFFPRTILEPELQNQRKLVAGGNHLYTFHTLPLYNVYVNRWE